MQSYLITIASYTGKLMLAGLCGGIVGYERRNRMKEAGIRTHAIVSLAAALMMVISKYGFNDVIVRDSINLDPSRIAAGVVTAIGFLGAGIIFVRKQAVVGLTTAAGIWATVGVGMAIGAGLYEIGVIATGLIIFLQVVLHRDFRWLKMPSTEQQVTFSMDSGKEAIDELMECLKRKEIVLSNFKIETTGNGTVEMDAYLQFPKAYTTMDILALYKESPHIKGIEI